MKLKLVIVLGTSCLLASALGAPAGSSGMGLKGGLSMAQLAYDPDVEDAGLGRRTGVGGGLTLGYTLLPYLCLDIDGMYMMKGAHWEMTFEDEGTYEEDWKLSYAVLSPVLRLRLPGGAMAPYVLAGGEVGYLLSAKVKQTAPGEADQEEDVEHDCEHFDYGLVAGAGLEIPIATGGRVLIEARYVRGLADIGKHEEDAGDDVGGDELKAMNDAIYVMAGFRF